jgi:hypothetical protein
VNLAEYKRLFGGQEDAAPGWDAIDGALAPLYPGQEPRHWGTVLKHFLGGPDPIDGISAYQCWDGGQPHLHFVTYGFTELYYNEEAVDKDFSRFGFELTFRLASELPPREDPIWVCSLLQNLARYVYTSGRWFEAGQWIPANGPIRAEYPTALTGLAFLPDPRLPAVDSPHGRVEFLQMFGITQADVDALKAKQCCVEDILERHRSTNPLFITDLARTA